MKKKILISILFIIGVILSGLTSAYAANYLYNSNEVYYDNSESNLTSSDVQGAIDELYTEATNYNSINTRVTALETLTGNNTLSITNKTLTGAVNELKSKKPTYEYLFNVWNTYDTEKTITSYNINGVNRKISNYSVMFVTASINNEVHLMGTITQAELTSNTIRGSVLFNNTNYYIKITYVNDTSIKVKSDFNGYIILTIYGLA